MHSIRKSTFEVSIVISALSFAALLPIATAQSTKKSSSSSSSSSSSYTPPPTHTQPTHVEPPSRPEPSYTPQPRPQPSYTPQPTNNGNNNYHPAPTVNNTTTPHNYTPGGNNGTTTHSYTPGGNNNGTAPHSYTPGGNNSNAPNTYTPGTTQTYTPNTTHTYTPGATSNTGGTTYTPGNSGTHSSNGVTIYTPNAPSNTGVHTASGTVYTPSAGSSASTASHQVYSLAGAGSGSGTPMTAKSSALDTKSSTSVIQQVNSSRASMTGINKHPLPAGAVTTNTNGSLTIAAAGGKQFNVRPNGTIASITSGHEHVAFTPSGKIRSVHTGYVDVYHGPRGVHTIVQHRPDKSTLVSTSRHSGYLERPFTHGGKQLVARTYVSRGKSTTRVYGSYSLHGHSLDHYIPGHTYVADYYGWAYYPWDAAIACAGGWDGQSWIGDFANYYALSQSCSGAADWLTNYLMGNTLADADQMQSDGDDANQDQAEDSQNSGDDPDSTYAQNDSPITPELQQAISQEVQQQIAFENAAARNPADAVALSDLPQALVPDHLFIVSTPLDVLTLDNRNCSLGTGNVIRMVTPPNDSNAAAILVVAASRKFDCPAGAQVTLSLDQLQEMENNYRAQIDGGLSALHQQQGQNGIPQAPYAAIQAPPVPSDEYPTDKPDVAALLKNAQAVGTQTEAQANQLANTQVASTAKH